MRSLCMIVMLAVSLAVSSGTLLHAQEISNDVIVILLDGSGSMNEKIRGTSIRRIDAAKDAIWKACENLSLNTKVGLLVFSNAVNESWVYPINYIDKDKLKQAIYYPRPSGGTPLGAYIKQGVDALITERKNQFNYGTYRFIVVTDGEAGDMGRMKRFAKEIPNRGIRFDVIGLDLAGDHALKQYSHSYIAANDTKTLDEGLRKVMVESVFTGSGSGDFEDTLLDAFSGGDVVHAMMKGLSNIPNHLLGEVPVQSSVFNDSDSVRDVSSASAPLATGTTPVDSGGSSGLMIIVFIACAIFAVVCLFFVLRT